MTLFKNKYRIESIRLKGWDYRNPGYYFVTICTKNRVPYFGRVIQGEMHLSPVGEIAAQSRITIQASNWLNCDHAQSCAWHCDHMLPGRDVAYNVSTG